MAHTLAACSVHNRGSFGQTSRPSGGQIFLAATAAAVVAVSVALLSARPAPSPLPLPEASVSPIVLTAGEGVSLTTLNDAAEIVRARLLAMPGIGAVRVHGLQVGGLEVEYAAPRLAQLGVKPTDLEAAVPSPRNGSAPGRIAVSLDVASAGPQAVADMTVHAGARAIRLGDLATVARVRLDSPVSTLSQDGQPAVQLVVTPALGEPGAKLDRSIAAALPKGVLMR